jgi:hypothetical protein
MLASGVATFAGITAAAAQHGNGCEARHGRQHSASGLKFHNFSSIEIVLVFASHDARLH